MPIFYSDTIDIVADVNWSELQSLQLGDSTVLYRLISKKHQIEKILLSPKMNHFISCLDPQSLTYILALSNFKFPILTIKGIESEDYQSLMTMSSWANYIRKVVIYISKGKMRDFEQERILSLDITGCQKFNVLLKWKLSGDDDDED
jgi:hypothetical protein